MAVSPSYYYKYKISCLTFGNTCSGNQHENEQQIGKKGKLWRAVGTATII